VIVVNEIGLTRIVTRYLADYHRSRTHLSLAKDSPQHRPVAPPIDWPSRGHSTGRRPAPSVRPPRSVITSSMALPFSRSKQRSDLVSTLTTRTRRSGSGRAQRHDEQPGVTSTGPYVSDRRGSVRAREWSFR
jgi:hypothetical protein